MKFWTGTLSGVVAKGILVVGIVVIQLASVTSVHAILNRQSAGAQQAAPGADQQRFAEVEELLRSIPTGQEALEQFQEYRVKVEFRPGAGTWYNHSTNTMFVDANKSAADAAFAFVHEMTHAARHHQGRTPDPMALSRRDYLHASLEEEAEADARAIEAKRQLLAAGIPISAMAAVLEEHYHQGFDAAVAEVKRREGRLSETASRSLARQAGKQAIIEGYVKGRAVSSHNLQTYPALYLKHWDKVHQVEPWTARYFRGLEEER